MKATIAFLNSEHQKMAEELLKGFTMVSSSIDVTGVDGATYVVAKIEEFQRPHLEVAFAETNQRFANGQMTLAIQ